MSGVSKDSRQLKFLYDDNRDDNIFSKICQLKL